MLGWFMAATDDEEVMWIPPEALRELYEIRGSIVGQVEWDKKWLGKKRVESILDIDPERGVLVKLGNKPSITAGKFLLYAWDILQRLTDRDQIPEWADGCAFDITLDKMPVKFSKYDEDTFYAKQTWSGSKCKISWDTFRRAIREYFNKKAKYFVITKDGKVYGVEKEPSGWQYVKLKIKQEL